MDRAERAGLGLAVAGHVLLFALLSLGLKDAAKPPEVVKPQPIDVSLVPDVAVEASAPKPAEPSAPSVAPNQGTPEEAAPPEVEAPPKPEPKPEPPAPEPKPVAKPVPVKPVAKPTPVAKPLPKPVPKPVATPKPAPTVKPAPAKPVAAKATPAKSISAKASAKPTASSAKTTSATESAKAKSAATKGTGTTATATATRPRGSRLGSDFLKGLSSDPSPAKAAAPAAAKVDGQALAAIQQAIARQIQPCADRQSTGGIPDDAKRVVVKFNLRLNPDGTLAATPRVVGRQNVDDDNSRYVQQIADIGIAAFKGCSPLKLPAEFYSTPSGGWNNINFQWKLR